LPIVDNNNNNGNFSNGIIGFSTNLIALLPYMISNYEKPDELCLAAADLYVKYLQQPAYKSDVAEHCDKSQKIKNEQLQNLSHVLNFYLNGKFLKDQSQWAKCVITYMSEYLMQFASDRSLSETNQSGENKKLNFHLNWIIYLTEVLEANVQGSRYQRSILICLNWLLSCINFNDTSNWYYINNELLRVLVPYLEGYLWKEALDLIKVAVNKSSSLAFKLNSASNKPESDSLKVAAQPSASALTDVSSRVSNLLFKKELPGRTLEFDFDFSPFSISSSRQSSPSSENKQIEKTSSLKHSANSETAIQDSVVKRVKKFENFHRQSSWLRPLLSQSRTKEKLVALLNSSGQHVGLPKSPSVIFSQNDILNNFYFSKKEQIMDDAEQNETLNDENQALEGPAAKARELSEQKVDGSNEVDVSMLNKLMKGHSESRFSIRGSQGLIDDNNFINNTFSFLDELDSQNAFINYAEAWKEPTIAEKNEQDSPLRSKDEMKDDNFPSNLPFKVTRDVNDKNFNSMTLTSANKQSAKQFLTGNLNTKTLPSNFMRSLNFKLVSDDSKAQKKERSIPNFKNLDKNDSNVTEEILTSADESFDDETKSSVSSIKMKSSKVQMFSNQKMAINDNEYINSLVSSLHIGDRNASEKETNTRSSICSADFEPLAGYQNEMSTLNSFTSSVPLINLLNISHEEIEDIWKNHVSSVSLNDDHANVIETFYLFKKLFKVKLFYLIET
jgi:hypothetical protein